MPILLSPLVWAFIRMTKLPNNHMENSPNKQRVRELASPQVASTNKLSNDQTAKEWWFNWSLSYNISLPDVMLSYSWFLSLTFLTATRVFAEKIIYQTAPILPLGRSVFPSDLRIRTHFHFGSYCKNSPKLVFFNTSKIVLLKHNEYNSWWCLFLIHGAVSSQELD